MKILNTTTGQIEELTHSGYDCDCVTDIIADDSTITWNEDDVRQGSEESINWWRTYLAADAEYMAAKAELVENLDEDQKEELENLLNDAMACDMEDQPKAGMRVIREWIANENAERGADFYSIEIAGRGADFYADGTLIAWDGNGMFNRCEATGNLHCYVPVADVRAAIAAAESALGVSIAVGAIIPGADELEA